MAMVHGGSLDWLTVESLVRTLSEDAEDQGAIGFMQEQGLHVGALRERLTKRFLESTKADWLLFVDSDIVWALEDVYRLVESTTEDCPVVAAVVFLSTPDGIQAAGWAEGGGTLDWDGSGLVAADMVGTGFTCYHRSALEQVHGKYGSTFAEAWEGEKFFGGDVAFSLRAREAGIPLHVNRDIRVGHVKRVVLDAGWARASRDARLDAVRRDG